jgi:hypothetical protein
MLNPQELLKRGFLPYRKTTITYAKQIRNRFSVRLDQGDVIHGKPGDYACVSPDDGGRWIVDREVFEGTYKPANSTVQQGIHKRLLRFGFRPYRKHQITWARKVIRQRVIHTLEGDVTVDAGDYLCIGPGGEQWPQKAERFEAHYEPVPVHARSK